MHIPEVGDLLWFAKNHDDLPEIVTCVDINEKFITILEDDKMTMFCINSVHLIEKWFGHGADGTNDIQI